MAHSRRKGPSLRFANGLHVAIHEAALVDYAGYVLEQGDHGVLKTSLTPWSDGARVRTKTPFKTPWRTLQIAPEASGLLGSDLILNLNEPNRLGDAGWVRPGKYVGVWWAMHLGEKTWGSGPRHGATTPEVKRYIDFAAEHGFAGVLVEGWNRGWDGRSSRPSCGTILRFASWRSSSRRIRQRRTAKRVRRRPRRVR